MANGNITTTTAEKHIDDVWVEGAIRSLEFKLVLAPAVDRGWTYQGHGDVYHKARIPNIETQTKSASTTLDAKTYTDTEQTITINQHIAAAIKNENIVSLLARNDVKGEMQSKMGYALARKVDVDIAALFASLSQSVGTLGVELTYDNLLRASQYLEEAGYDMAEDVFWFFSPAQRSGLLKMDTFTNSQYVGDANALSAHERATLARFMGAPIAFSNLITSPAAGQHDNVLFHKETFACIMAQEPKTTLDTIALDLATVVVMDEVYAVSEVDRYSESPGNITATDEGGVWLKGV